jgi:hypothetical protein
LSEEAFWHLTLGQLIALTRRWEAEQESKDYRTAVITSNILNTIPRTKETKHKIFTPADIYPQYSWGREREYESMPEKKPEDQLRHYRRLTKMMNGKITERVCGDEG